MSVRRATALGIALTIAACGPGRPRDDTELVIQNVTTSLQGVLLLAQLAEIAFEVDPNLATTSVVDAGPIATGDLVANINVLTDLLGCPEASITTDDATFVEATIDCASTAFNAALRGTLRTEVSFEAVVCGPDSCVQALNWTLSSVGPTPFTYVAGDIDVQFAVPALLRFPVDDSERSLVTDRVDIISASPSSAEVDARWTAQPCITMDLDLFMTETPGMEDPALAGVYPIVVSSDEVRVCLGRCPERGDVHISYAFGAILEWMYTNGPIVRVLQPGGRVREATLDCAL